MFFFLALHGRLFDRLSNSLQDNSKNDKVAQLMGIFDFGFENSYFGHLWQFNIAFYFILFYFDFTWMIIWSLKP